MIKYINLKFNYLSYSYKIKIYKFIFKNLFKLQYLINYFKYCIKIKNSWHKIIRLKSNNIKKFNVLDIAKIKLIIYKNFILIKKLLREFVKKILLSSRKRLHYRNKYKYLWNDLLYNLYSNVPKKILFILVKSLNKYIFSYHQHRLGYDIDWYKKLLSKYYFTAYRRFYNNIQRSNYYITKVMRKFEKYVFIPKRYIARLINYTFKFRKACRRIKSLMSDDSMFWSLTPWERIRFSYRVDDSKPHIYPQKIAVFDFNRIEYSEYLAERDREFSRYVYDNYSWRRYLFMKEETKIFNNRVSRLIQCFNKTSLTTDSLWMYFRPWVKKIKNKISRRKYFYRNNCNLIYKKFPSRESKIIKRSFLYRNNKIVCTHFNRLSHFWNDFKIKLPDIPVLQYSTIYLKRFRKLKYFKRLKLFFYNSKFEYYNVAYCLRLLGKNFYSLKKHILQKLYNIFAKNKNNKIVQKLIFLINIWKILKLEGRFILLSKFIKFLLFDKNKYLICVKKFIFSCSIKQYFLKSFYPNAWKCNIGIGSLKPSNLDLLVELQKFLKGGYNIVPQSRLERFYKKFQSLRNTFIVWGSNLKFIKLYKFLMLGYINIKYICDNIIFNIYNKFYLLYRYLCVVNFFRKAYYNVKLFDHGSTIYARLTIFDLSSITNVPRYNKYIIGKKFLCRVKTYLQIFIKKLYYNLLIWILYYFTCMYTYKKWISGIEWVFLLSTIHNDLFFTSTKFNISLTSCVNIVSSYKYWDQFSKFINSSWYWYNSIDKTFSKSELYKYRSKFIRQRRFSKRIYCNLIRLNVPQNIVMGIICS